MCEFSSELLLLIFTQLGLLDAHKEQHLVYENPILTVHRELSGETFGNQALPW